MNSHSLRPGCFPKRLNPKRTAISLVAVRLLIPGPEVAVVFLQHLEDTGFGIEDFPAERRIGNRFRIPQGLQRPFAHMEASANLISGQIMLLTDRRPQMFHGRFDLARGLHHPIRQFLELFGSLRNNVRHTICGSELRG